MTVLTDDKDVKAFCDQAKGQDLLYVDTEFMRERTYFAQTCLIQIGLADGTAVALDVIANPDLNLKPLADLLADERITKVFHAARQDLEICFQLFGGLPKPLFDSQIAAMALGFPEQVSFDTLCRHYAKKAPDKSQQFTDWTRRPLSKSQIDYALDDVRLLAVIHAGMLADMERLGRSDWVNAELADMVNPAQFDVDPQQVWQRLKFRDPKPVTLAVARELAAWREETARRKNVPRGRVLKDDILQELAVRHPASLDEMSRLRGVPADTSKGGYAKDILAAINRGLECPADQRPTPQKYEPFPSEKQGTLEMLKLLHKVEAARHKVTPRLLATADELEGIARVPLALGRLGLGWRYELLGKDAELLLQGRLAFRLTADGDIEKTLLD